MRPAKPEGLRRISAVEPERPASSVWVTEAVDVGFVFVSKKVEVQVFVLKKIL